MSHAFKFRAIRAARFATFAIGSAVDFLTSRAAMRFYRKVGQYAWIGVQGAIALILLLGLACLLLGWMTRQGVYEAQQWCNEFVASCETPTIDVQPALAPVAAPIALLAAPAPEPVIEAAPWDEAPARVLITPAPVAAIALPTLVALPALPAAVEVAEMAVAQPAKGKRGRPKGSKSKSRRTA